MRRVCSQGSNEGSDAARSAHRFTRLLASNGTTVQIMTSGDLDICVVKPLRAKVASRVSRPPPAERAYAAISDSASLAGEGVLRNAFQTTANSAAVAARSQSTAGGKVEAAQRRRERVAKTAAGAQRAPGVAASLARTQLRELTEQKAEGAQVGDFAVGR